MSDQLKGQWAESIPEMHAAIIAHMEAAQEKEGNPAFTVSFSIKLDWGGNRARTKLSFNQKFTNEADAELPDPNQPKLPGMEEEP